MMDGRRWSEGLHQAVEAKEGVQIMPENQTLASITFQNYFRMYPKLGGMTGTAATEAAEFFDIYKLNVVEIPTNVPVQRKDVDDEFYKNGEDKYKAIVKSVREAHLRSLPARTGLLFPPLGAALGLPPRARPTQPLPDTLLQQSSLPVAPRSRPRPPAVAPSRASTYAALLPPPLPNIEAQNEVPGHCAAGEAKLVPGLGGCRGPDSEGRPGGLLLQAGWAGQEAEPVA
jgi:hypothetical protein